MRHSHRELSTAKNVIPFVIPRLRIEWPQASPASAALPKLYRGLLRYFSSTTTAEQVHECGLLRDIEKLGDPADVPKVRQALSELTPSNYSKQLESLGVVPPEPGWSLDELLRALWRLCGQRTILSQSNLQTW